MTVVPASFPEINQALVNTRNRLISKDIHFALDSDYGEIHVNQFELVESLCFHDGLYVQAQVGDSLVQCVIPVKDADIILSPFFDGVMISELPELLVEASIEKILGFYQSSIKMLFGCWSDLKSVNLVDVGSSVSPKSNEIILRAQGSYKRQPFLMYFISEQEALKQFTVRHAKPLHRHTLSIDMALQLSFGRVTLPLASIQTLELGDVLIFDVCYFADGKQQCLSIEGKPAWLVEFEQSSIKIFAPWSEKMNQQAYEIESEVSSDFDVEALGVDVNFEMPEQRMALSEVKSLAPGYVFDLQLEPSQAIHITINGSQLGLGELVSVGGKLGVRLTSINHGR